MIRSVDSHVAFMSPAYLIPYAEDKFHYCSLVYRARMFWIGTESSSTVAPPQHRRVRIVGHFRSNGYAQILQQNQPQLWFSACERINSVHVPLYQFLITVSRQPTCVAPRTAEHRYNQRCEIQHAVINLCHDWMTRSPPLLLLSEHCPAYQYLQTFIIAFDVTVSNQFFPYSSSGDVISFLFFQRTTAHSASHRRGLNQLPRAPVHGRLPSSSAAICRPTP